MSSNNNIPPAMSPGPPPAGVKSQGSGDSVALLNEALKRIADLEALVKSPRPSSAARGKPGRKATSADIAAFANERRPAMSWKEICCAWKREHPKDPRAKDMNPEKVRDAWRRHFGGKGNKQI